MKEVHKNLDGTLKEEFTLGKKNKVSIRNNDGVLEGKYADGDYFPIAPSGYVPPSGVQSTGNLVKMFQGIDVIGAMKVTNISKVIPLSYVSIKDDYYSHSTSVNNGEVSILSDGWYKISAMTTVATNSASQGIRGNPILNIEIDSGSGFVAQPDNMGGYIRENSAGQLSCSMTGVGFFEFNENDKVRLTIRDSVTNEPDESTVPYSSRLVLEYIDRTGAAADVVENLKDIGDVEADSPNNNDTLRFNVSTSKWEAKSREDRNIDGGRADTTYFVGELDGGGA